MALHYKIFISLIIPCLFLVSCGKEDLLVIDDTFFLRNQGADMPVYVNGNRESKTFVIVLHGAGSFGLSFRNGAFTEILEQEFAFVYWDQRGQGTSQGNYSAPENIIELMASDIVALVNVLKEKYGDNINLFLMGHSLGGMLGLEALLKQGLQNDITGWISISGAHDFELIRQNRPRIIIEVAREQINIGNSTQEWEEILEEVEGLDPISDDGYNAILRLVPRATKLLEGDGVVSTERPSGLLANTIFQNNPITWQVSHLFNQPVNYAVKNNYSLSNLLPQLTIPSLWLYGKYDFSVPVYVGINGFHRVGSVTKDYIMFDESMHHLHYTESDDFAEKVSFFINWVL
ncbi:MAG: alpha/beta hydrolase [Cyclobacteriaceae bacterium]|nr:alpha/beta hydrolase [Cyclobacteriaceae bacterium]